MAELVIIVVAAVIAPLVVLVVVAIARSAGLIAPVGRQTPAVPPPSRQDSSVLRSKLPNPLSTEGGDPDDVKFCQACGRTTSAHASYCRSCGTKLDNT